MTPSVVFQFLLAAGAHFVGTTIRCLYWLFTYQQKMRENNRRTEVEVAGAASLFVKKIAKFGRTIHAAAFRNGLEKVSTTISSLHFGHHWGALPCFEMKQKNMKEEILFAKLFV